ncbi:MAG: ATP-binding protein [Desulfoferrobacter sp.]
MLRHTTNSVKYQDGRISRESYPYYLKKTKLKRSAASVKVMKQSREAKRKEIEDHDRWTERIDSLRNLAAGVAHDFNNLLQGIQGQAELALLIRENGEKLDGSMREIIKAVQRGAEITKHLLAFSGISEAVFNLIDLSIEVQKVHETLRPMLPECIETKLDLVGDPVVISADPSQISKILLNLAMNAKDAMQEGGKLKIRTGTLALADGSVRSNSVIPDGEYGLLSVSDTGHGMNNETIRHIFDPFYTGRGRTAKRGLGLAVVYGLVKNHGGYIFCTSEVNRGTTFEILLPLLRGNLKYPLADQTVPSTKT